MKKYIWVLTTFIISFLLFACDPGGGSADKCKGICQKLDSGYINYLRKIDSIGNLRGENPDDSLMAAIPISERIGWHYVSKFQGEYQARALPQTHYLKISRENIEFLYKQMWEENLDSLAFAFAKYDTTGFASLGNLQDTIYNVRAEKMKGRYSIVIGGWRAADKDKFVPFSVKGLRFKFYDDWHNEDP